MPTYTIIALVSTESEPTDLELSDVCLQLADCLDSPVVEMVDGSYGQADFRFDSWSLEMYEESGDRVWLYTLNAKDPRLADSDDLDQDDDGDLRSGLQRRWWHRLFGI